LLRFLTERLRAIDGVRETETFVYLRMVKQTYQWGTR
jgi:Lrp/AsnC family transcriptional regulator for asnA, asnC and gidA